jgi:hypothetical protein
MATGVTVGTRLTVLRSLVAFLIQSRLDDTVAAGSSLNPTKCRAIRIIPAVQLAGVTLFTGFQDAVTAVFQMLDLAGNRAVGIGLAVSLPVITLFLGLFDTVAAESVGIAGNRHVLGRIDRVGTGRGETKWNGRTGINNIVT